MLTTFRDVAIQLSVNFEGDIPQDVCGFSETNKIYDFSCEIKSRCSEPPMD